MGQSHKDKQDNNFKNSPKVDVKVNKEYDKDGNLIRYDSIYSSYYSSMEGDTLFADSIMLEFGSFFNNNFPSVMNQHFSDLMLQDSIWSNDFFTDDFFSRGFYNDNQAYQKMFQDLDSLKNRFFMHNR